MTQFKERGTKMKTIKLLIMVVCMSLLLTLPVFAAEDEESAPTTDTPIAETPTEEENEPSTEVEAPTEETTLPDSMTEEDVAGYWNGFKETISNISVWLMGIMGVSGVAAVGFITKWAFAKIFDKISENASKTETKIDDKLVENRAAIEGLVNNKIDTLAAELTKLEEATQTTMENQSKIDALLTLFFTNVKISNSAKAEILAIATGIKKYEGDLAGIVAEAQKAIDQAREDQMTLAEPTPELDKLIEETTYMKLG
jgi:hypothetical protein